MSLWIGFMVVGAMVSMLGCRVERCIQEVMALREELRKR